MFDDADVNKFEMCMDIWDVCTMYVRTYNMYVCCVDAGADAEGDVRLRCVNSGVIL